ncbi:hypothetical protein SUGI_0483160 [Cryptomeria japonica]|nr:hypothetical protein SUGI_0483160 [Cryptomeria japonica]
MFPWFLPRKDANYLGEFLSSSFWHWHIGYIGGLQGFQGFMRFSTRENAHLQRLQGPSKQSPDDCFKQMETQERSQKRLAEIGSMENRVQAR